MRQNNFIDSILNEVYGYYTKGLLTEEIDELGARHASRASFDKFDHSFMGTGCGNQVYGWGTYVSTNPEVHQGYMDSIKGEGKSSWIPGTVKNAVGGWAYDVEIPDDNGENYIDWNGPVPEKVAKAFGVDGNDYGKFGVFYDEESYNSSPKEVSLKLSSLGYTGIKVAAFNNSGNTSMQQPNYVIFKENDIQITGKHEDRDTEDVKFQGNIGIVQNGEGKCGVINRAGELINNQWYNWVDDFRNGFARVALGKKWNYIKADGQLLRDDLWFDSVGYFYKGFAIVGLGNKWNLIKADGQILRDDLWFDGAGNFFEGFARVKLGNKWNFIKADGQILRDDQWFDSVGYFDNGFAIVKLGKKFNYIKADGQILRDDQWFDGVGDFEEGFAIVLLNGKENFINQEGQYLSDQWFDGVDSFYEGFAEVKLNGKWYLIDGESTLYDYDTQQPIQLPKKGQDTVSECVRRVIKEYLNR